jgi:hypothetical protein
MHTHLLPSTHTHTHTHTGAPKAPPPLPVNRSLANLYQVLKYEVLANPHLSGFGACVRVSVCIYMYVRMCVCMYMRVCMYVCMYVHVYMYMRV